MGESCPPSILPEFPQKQTVFRHREPDKWEVSPTDLVLEEEIGKGFFGTVYKGKVQRALSADQTPAVATSASSENGEVATSLEDVNATSTTTTTTTTTAAVPTSHFHVIVAIKMLKDHASGVEKARFLDEIDIMKKVAAGESPHILRMVGCVACMEPLCLLTEFMNYGDLLTYLKSIRNMVFQEYSSLPSLQYTNDSGYIDLKSLEEESKSNIEKEVLSEEKATTPVEKATTPVEKATTPVEKATTPVEKATTPVQQHTSLLSVTPQPDSAYATLGQVETTDLISFAFQIASGMEYLSSQNVIHRDLACRNILLGDNKTLKIADFGMSRVVTTDDPIYTRTTNGHLPWRWMALECLQDTEFTVASDVWAYGVVLWEITSLGKYPYPSIPNEQLFSHLIGGNRLPCPRNCKDEIYQVMLQCWDSDLQKRPKFTELKAKFKDFLKDHGSSHVEFPDPSIEEEEEVNDTSATPPENNTTTTTTRVSAPPESLPALLVDRYSQEVDRHSDTPVQFLPEQQEGSNLLGIQTGRLRPRSEPIFAGEDGDSGDNVEESDLDRNMRNKVKRSTSAANPYVKTPKRNSQMQTQGGDHFEWVTRQRESQNPPQILVSSDCD